MIEKAGIVQREGNLLFVLTPHDWAKGKQTFRNLFTINFDFDKIVGGEERESIISFVMQSLKREYE